MVRVTLWHQVPKYGWDSLCITRVTPCQPAVSCVFACMREQIERLRVGSAELLSHRTSPHHSHQWSNSSDRQPEMTSSEARARRLPDVIIIGVKKCGTRALLEFLRAHDDVRAPGPEVHFFDRHYDKGLDWYRCVTPRDWDEMKWLVDSDTTWPR